MKTIFRLLPLLLLGLLACHQPGPGVEPNPGTGGGTPTEVGKPIGAITTKIIGAAGGYLDTPDGKLRLTFPAGALTTDTPITIQPVENKAINGVGIGYEFGPDGTKFAKPVTFTYHYEADELLGTTPQAMALASQNAQGIWVMERFVKVDPATRTITGKLDHFSWWAIITLFHMTPEAGVVGPGQSLKLRVTQAAEVPDLPTSTNVDDLPLLAELSVKATKNALIKEISLNGSSKWSDLLNPANPNGYLGYDASGKEAVIEYFAPVRVPEQNPVAVGVTLALPSKAQFMLVSNINVMRENSFTIKGNTFDDVQATAIFSGGQFVLSMIDLAKPAEMGNLYARVHLTGEGTAAFVAGETGVVVGMKGGDVQGKSSFTICGNPQTESGSVTISKLYKQDGKTIVEGTLQGSVVEKHGTDPKDCNIVTIHETFSISARFKVAIP